MNCLICYHFLGEAILHCSKKDKKTIFLSLFEVNHHLLNRLINDWNTYKKLYIDGRVFLSFFQKMKYLLLFTFGVFIYGFSFAQVISTCQDFPISLHLNECDRLENSFERIWKSYSEVWGGIYFNWLHFSVDNSILLEWASLDDFRIIHIDYWTKTMYAKDANHLYKNWLILEWYDRDSFEVVYWVYAKDKNYVYDRGLNIIEFEWLLLDPNTFELVRSGVIKDKNWSYYFNPNIKTRWSQYQIEKIEWINIDNLTNLAYWFASDWNNIYYKHSNSEFILIEEFDVESFIPDLWYNLVKDVNGVYFFNALWSEYEVHKIPELATESIEIIKDTSSNSWNIALISNDKSYLLFKDYKKDTILQLQWIDGDSFEFLGYNFIADKNWVYRYSEQESLVQMISNQESKYWKKFTQIDDKTWWTVSPNYYTDSVNIYDWDSFESLNNWRIKTFWVHKPIRFIVIRFHTWELMLP